MSQNVVIPGWINNCITLRVKVNNLSVTTPVGRGGGGGEVLGVLEGWYVGGFPLSLSPEVVGVPPP